MFDFEGLYNVHWTLEDGDGKRWTETHTNMSLTDFEIEYGNKVNKLIDIRMELIIDDTN